MVAEGKQHVEVDGKRFPLETALRADFALINAKRSDDQRIIEYALTARNFNPLMALAGRTAIAEAEEIVPVGAISPDAVVTPGVLVHHLVARTSA